MARSIAEIKGVMTGEFMASEEMQIKYGFKAGDKWEDKFSKVSVENILFYVFAAGLHIVEKLFDTHKAEVDAALDTRLPHTARWYREKALGYIQGKNIDNKTGEFNTEGLSESEIESNKPVKFAAAVQAEDASILKIKVAGGAAGARQPISDTQLDGLKSYFEEVKDAGVQLEFVNKEADKFYVKADIVYNQSFIPGDVKSAVERAITDYIENLPFNGQYSNMKLVDAIQQVAGVKDVYLSEESYLVAGSDAKTHITARYVPEAGYMTKGEYDIP